MAGRSPSLVDAQALWPASPSHHAACSACASDADPATLYTGATDGTVVSWTVSSALGHQPTLSPTMLLCGHPAPVTTMCTAQHRLVSVDASGGVCVWDTVHQMGLHRSQHPRQPRTVAWIDGMLLFPGASPHTLDCVHPDTCQTLRTLLPSRVTQLHAIDCASPGAVCIPVSSRLLHVYTGNDEVISLTPMHGRSLVYGATTQGLLITWSLDAQDGGLYPVCCALLMSNNAII